ncbi:chymotrypsin-1-like [Daphnia carinata]|uniref:chymotrypsin-1-like n=1 Tax=Daphnia carinata TaxID=120202 RepID=UPI00258051F3|nr:chymotrypsin-1-like [Daphnia carinata]
MKLILFVVAIIFRTTGSFSQTDRIVGGDVASSGQFPYVVSITEDGRHICGGFIYSPRWIVTAASCIVGKSYTRLNVVAGQLSLLNPDINEQIMTVYTLNPIPEYNSTNKANDIALVRLTAGIVFDYEYVDFIEYNNEVDYTKTALTMGWGATYEGGYESINLRHTDVFPSKNSTCGAFGNEEFNPSTMICAAATLATGTPAGSPCTYDEGSPLVQEFIDPANASLKITTAVGVYSKTQICELGQPGVYTRLSFFAPWLLNTAGPQPQRPL